MKQTALSLANEQWLISRLRAYGATHIDSGDTNVETRRERVRSAIVERGLIVVVAGSNAQGKPEFFPDAFERIYGEPFLAVQREYA